MSETTNVADMDAAASEQQTRVAASEERRGAVRRRVLFGGEIRLSDYFEPVVCVIRNLSDSGARLSLPANDALPAQFPVSIVARQTRMRARLVWRDGAEVGVAFERRDDPLPAFLRDKPDVPTACQR